MATTDPVAVFLLLDTGHLYWAGDDPLSLAKAYADRIKHVHLKDIRPDVIGRSAQHNLSFEESIREGVFTVPGDGAIEFKPILQVLADYGYEGWLTIEAEQDHRKAHPLTYALKARAYLREITGL
jgi:inosose dehydratase